MIRSVLMLGCGILFGAGLAIAGMLNPAKVAGFLDIFGLWDPSLAFVMGGGVALNLIGHRLVIGRGHPLFAPNFSLPTRSGLDVPLLLGAAIFGIGWGVAGLCPGPAVASVLLKSSDGVVFGGGVFLLLLLAGLFVGQKVKNQMLGAAV